jgi:hypothetical protein
MNSSPAIALHASSESDGAEKDQKDFFTDGLTGTLKSALLNPVLPSEFDLLALTLVVKHKWQFANRNLVTFAMARKSSQSWDTIGEL